ncbi:MAG: alpha-L-fucosidase [Victivallales bacterium]|nr:alpha-L-fucosidase [Victivallales bacterium]
MAWFKQARFGIYVHFGLYSLTGRGEWTMYSERIPFKEYSRLADQFQPAAGCCDEWCEAARRAGANYIVLTTRHHEGFCLFDSKVSDYTSVRHGAHRDIVAEFVAAARRHGLHVGLYYSLLDWRFPGYFEPEKYPESAREMVEQAHAQVRELMTNYGKIEVLEYDGGWDSKLCWSRERRAAFWRSRELNDMVRSLQPDIIINDRANVDEDLETPEQVVRAGKSRVSESCMCIGDSCGWGYTRFNPNWKSAEQLLQHLVMASQLGGNYLLNIGPQPDGRIRNEEYERLSELGKWLAVNGESIYGVESCELIGASQPGFVDLNLQGPWTRRGSTAYWMIFRWPGQVATAVRVATAPRAVTLLQTGEAQPFEWSPATRRLIVRNLPALPPDPLCTVLKCDFDEVPRRAVEEDLAAWI